jgi:ABC-type transport system substrate-binding protein
VSDALTYLHNATRGLDDWVVLDDMTLQFNARAPGPILKVLEYESFCAVSPKFVIENRPGRGMDAASTTPWTNDTNDDIYGMVPLDQWFPTLNATDTLDKLGIDDTVAGFDFTDSGVVPNSGIALDAEHLWYKEHQVGTGPYKVVSITDVEQSLTKNTAWWNAANFHPNAPTDIVWQVVGESATRFLALKSGDADQAQGLASAQINELARNDNGIAVRPFQSLVDNVILYNSPGLVHTDVFFNLNETLPSTYIGEAPSSTYNVTYDENGTTDTADDVPRKLYAYGEGHPTWQAQIANSTNPFTSVLFRTAFAKSLDVQALINTAYSGLGIIPQGNIPSSMNGAVTDLISNGYQPTYDPDGAKAFFEELGWKGTITIAANQGNIQRKTTGLLLKDVIESFEIGISINVLEMVWATFLTERNRGVFPVSISGWGADYVDPHNFVVPFYDSTAGTYSKDQKYNNPRVDQLIDEGIAEQDPAKRAVIYRYLLQNASLDVANIPVFETASFNHFPVWIEGVEDDTAGTVGAGSGALHPFKANFWAYLGKADTYTPVPGWKPAATTAPTSATSATSATSTTTTGGTPGFEALVLLAGALSVGTIALARRKRKN